MLRDWLDGLASGEIHSPGDLPWMIWIIGIVFAIAVIAGGVWQAIDPSETQIQREDREFSEAYDEYLQDVSDANDSRYDRR